MAIEHITSARKADLKTEYQYSRDERVFLDFRRQDYPELTQAAMAYNRARPDYNMPGSASAFIGTANYPSDGLVAHYTMDNVTGPTLEDDFGANNGTITGAVQVAGVPGLGLGLRFDGVDDTVSIPSGMPSGDCSWAYWFKISEIPSASEFIVNQEALVGSGRYSFIDSSGNVFFVSRRSDGTTSATSIAPVSSYTIGSWVNVVGVQDGVTTKIYIDGTLIDSDTHADIYTSFSADGDIGSNSDASSYFDGDIDDVRIYNRALTETEIEYLYNVRTNVLADIEPDYLVEMPETFTMRMVVRPWFDYTSTVFRRFFEWYNGASTNRFAVAWNSTGDYVYAFWVDGGTVRTIQSIQFDDGTSLTDLNQWLTIDVAIDLTTGTTAGSQMWINKVSQDTTWSGNIDAKVSDFPRLSFGHEAGSSNAKTEFAYCMLIPDYVATDADIQNDFADVTNEAIVWDFNGEGVGRTRVNVTSYVERNSRSKSKENAVGSYMANRATTQLLNTDGVFSDDQYASYYPTGGNFNGLSTQAYLQKRSRIWHETWKNGDRETVFFGELENSRYSRASSAGATSRVNLSAVDFISRVARERKRRARHYEDYHIVDTDESNSLLHTIVRLASQAEIFNYAANSGFETATITDSWTASGAGFVLTKDTTDEFFGTACASLDATGGAGTIQQTILYTGNVRLNVGDTYTLAVMLKCSGAAGSVIEIEEHDSGGVNDQSQEIAFITFDQDYYQIYSVTHTITDSDSDRLVIKISAPVTTEVFCDSVMLTKTGVPTNWIFETTHDGSSGSVSADDAQSDAYDTIGFICEPVDITHPWALIPRNTSIWEHVKSIGDAIGARAFGLNAAGVFKERAALGGWGDPDNLDTITEDESVSVATSTDTASANRIVIHGVRIVKAQNEQVIWTAKGARFFENAAESRSDEQPYITIANGATYPDSDTYGRFIARYGKV